MAHQNLIPKSLNLLIVFVIGLIMFSCQKDFNPGNDPVDVPADLSTKVNASISGFVTDENDEAIAGASVQFGMATAMTDEYGYFEIRNSLVSKNAAMVSVNMNGYFKGIKTFIAQTGQEAFFRIKLLPKDITGNITASAGGTVTLTNGMSINFPANAIVNASTNAAYSGTVNVAATWIDPTAGDINEIMPGDLRGIDENGNLKGLTTYGMAAVELTGSGGEMLQIKTGMTAKLTMPLPASIQATAPATIPLWYFDEAVGLWKEEGVAVKTGASYVGEVSHFSFWNCDVPANYVQFNCTVVDSGNHPIANARVKISVVSNPNNWASGYTNAAGYVAGAIPANQTLLLQVFSGYNCSLPLYSQTFTSTNVNVSLGNITITNTATAVATVSGTVTNCSGNPVTSGYIIMKKNNSFYRYSLAAGGTFSFATTLCSTTTGLNVTLIAEDSTASQQSPPMAVTLVAGLNAVGNLQACGVSTSQFLNYTVNSTTYSFTHPADSVQHQGSNAGTNNIYSIVSGLSGNSYASVSFVNAGIAVGSSQALNYFNTNSIPDSTTILSPIVVNITEYGTVGGYISGNFTGTLVGAAPLNTTYTITANFRVRRRF